MQKIVSVSEMRDIEKAADKAGLTYDEMMQRAGKAVADVICEGIGELQGLLVTLLVGSGNNGGDALVAAHYLAAAGAEVRAYLSKKRSGDKNQNLAEEAGVIILHFDGDRDAKKLTEIILDCDILVDGLLGTGCRLPLKGQVATILNIIKTKLAEADNPPAIFAVDCPSGLDCDTGAVAVDILKADVTITMAAAKRGFFLFPAAEYVGNLMIADIGITETLPEYALISTALADREGMLAILPKRPLHSHKGTFGKVQVIGGSIMYPGAALLSALGAYRCGCGLVSIATPAPVQALIATAIPEATWLILPHHLGVVTEAAVSVLKSKASDANAWLIGPGMGNEPESRTFLHRLLSHSQDLRGKIGFISTVDDPNKADEILPALIIDADGLNTLAEIPQWFDMLPAGVILTPHPGEMARLSGLSVEEIESNRVEIAQEYASRWQQVLVLKGAYTVIATPDGYVTIIPVASSGLASAGSGDVLAGVIAALRAQGLSPADAAALGAYIHAVAGLLAVDGIGSEEGVMAQDIAKFVPVAIALLRNEEHDHSYQLDEQ